MEAVVDNDEGKSSFQALQATLGTHSDSIIAYVFDILYLNGRDLTKLPLRERKKTLQALLSKSKSGAALLYSEHIEGNNGGEMLAKAGGLGLEGIVSERAEERAPLRVANSHEFRETRVQELNLAPAFR